MVRDHLTVSKRYPSVGCGCTGHCYHLLFVPGTAGTTADATITSLNQLLLSHHSSTFAPLSPGSFPLVVSDKNGLVGRIVIHLNFFGLLSFALIGLGVFFVCVEGFALGGSACIMVLVGSICVAVLVVGGHLLTLVISLSKAWLDDIGFDAALVRFWQMIVGMVLACSR